MVVVLAYLIPVSMLLRALVLEKEMKLREQLLTMGATLGAYYGAVFTTHGATFVLTGAICASMLHALGLDARRATVAARVTLSPLA